MWDAFGSGGPGVVYFSKGNGEWSRECAVSLEDSTAMLPPDSEVARAAQSRPIQIVDSSASWRVRAPSGTPVPECL